MSLDARIPLIAQSPSRFGVAGEPPTRFMEVVERDGKVVALRVAGMADQLVELRQE